MTVSVVLRLIPDELRSGKIVGEAEVVATGERQIIRSMAELVALLHDLPQESASRSTA